MEKTQGFYDFCVPFNNNEIELRNIIKQLIELGYRTIALDHTCDHTAFSGNKRGQEIFPEPPNIKTLEDDFRGQIKILQRLTIIYTDPSVTHAMSNSVNLKRYHLVAGQPKTDAALTHCCTTFKGDLVTFDHRAGIKLLVNRKAFKLASDRGMYFELKYALAIRDSNLRKDMIKIAHNYFIRGKTKNIIFSSGAEHEFELRGPYDVAKLAFIFGLSDDQGMCAIDRYSRCLFLNAESRRLGKTIMVMKCKGPIVLDGCSNDEEMSTDDGTDTSTANVSKDRSDDEHSSTTVNLDFEHPNKKQKLS